MLKLPNQQLMETVSKAENGPSRCSLVGNQALFLHYYSYQIY